MHDLDVVDRATKIFSTLIDQEKAGSGGGGDHFAKAGANDRIWNALEKHCLFDADNFARYYASDAIAMGAEAWLGRGYQMTAQVNRVNREGRHKSRTVTIILVSCDPNRRWIFQRMCMQCHRF